MIERRKFLVRLLSSVAVVAAGPVVKLSPTPPADLVAYGQSPEMMETLQFLEGMTQRLVQTFVYGDPEAPPLAFAGLSTFYDPMEFGHEALSSVPMEDK